MLNYLKVKNDIITELSYPFICENGNNKIVKKYNAMIRFVKNRRNKYLWHNKKIFLIDSIFYTYSVEHEGITINCKRADKENYTFISHSFMLDKNDLNEVKIDRTAKVIKYH